jgi:hypothetical protein
MTLQSAILVYPDGDTQEARQPLRINQVVDLNGFPLQIPLRSDKMIVYTVSKIRRSESRAEEITYYYLELINRDEISEYL